MNGTVLMYGATIKTGTFSTHKLVNLIKYLVKKAGLSERRFDIEDYGQPEGAKTITLYLDESHCMITTYPEEALAEIELASCKYIDLRAMLEWIKGHYEVVTDFFLRKNKEGIWETL